MLRELFAELATGKYDVSSSQALRRLDSDRRRPRMTERNTHAVLCWLVGLGFWFCGLSEGNLDSGRVFRPLSPG